MSIIENIPEEMIDEHVRWHTRPGRPGEGGRAIDPWPPGAVEAAPGSGAEFLVWHEGFIERFREWASSLPASTRPPAEQTEPWTAVPTGLKMGMVGWTPALAQDEARLRNMRSFTSLDDLGRFLEWGLHPFLHIGSERMWNEPVLTSFESPRSTYFWQLHGLVDQWRREWNEAASVPRPEFPTPEFPRPGGFPSPWPGPWPSPWPPPWPWPPPGPWPPFPPIPPRPGPDPAPPFRS